MDKPKIIVGQNLISLEYFAFREYKFAELQGYGETPEEAMRDLLNKERLAEMQPEEVNISIKITKGKIYYGIDDVETAEYLADEYNLQESFENFIAYFLPIYKEEEDDELVNIEGLL